MVANIDGVNRLIYLDATTVNTSIHPVDIYRAVRELRRTDESLQKYDNFMEGAGNVSKGGGKSTERYFILLDGARIVPFDTTHVLDIIGTLISDDELEGPYCFNRTPLTPGVIVDIQYIPRQVEVITIEVPSNPDAIAIADEVMSRDVATKGDVYASRFM